VYGETTPGVSAGSKSVGARVKWRAKVIWPSGAASAHEGTINVTASTPTRTCRRMWTSLKKRLTD
jgi:hypothetical protein